jgi:hypothetical protein
MALLGAVCLWTISLFPLYKPEIGFNEKGDTLGRKERGHDARTWIFIYTGKIVI